MTIQASSLLDSSLPPAVRKSFVLVAGFAAAGGKAGNQHVNGRVGVGGKAHN